MKWNVMCLWLDANQEWQFQKSNKTAVHKENESKNKRKKKTKQKEISKVKWIFLYIFIYFFLGSTHFYFCFESSLFGIRNDWSLTE